MRSFLFVPGDSPRKFERGSQGPADALILDLEDSVSPDRKAEGRSLTREMLNADRRQQKVFVRVNALETGLTLEDLAAVMSGRPNGIVLPKCSSADQVRQLSLYLDAFETASGLGVGSTRIVAIATETAESLFGLSGYRDCSPRLWGLMWGGEDLSASIGATENRRNGVYHSPYRLARDLCLMAASAAGVAAIDTVYTDIDDLAGLEEEARFARRDGFSAKAVIHPKHVEAVNAAFTPSAEEVAWAERIVAAFALDPGMGVVKLDGKMVDKPHLRVAEKIMAVARTGAPPDDLA